MKELMKLQQKSHAHLTLLGCVWLLGSFGLAKQGAASTLTCNVVTNDINIDKTTFLSFPKNTQCITKTTSEVELKDYLKQDRTNKMAYNPNVNNEQKWFTCHQFSTQLMLRLGCFEVDPSYQLLEVKTKIRYTDSPIKDLPMFQVSFFGKDKKGKNFVSHAINALYNPLTPSGLDDISNFTFVEPQEDKIYSSIEGVMDDWGITTIDLQINAPDKIDEMEQRQCRAQYSSRVISKFHCEITD